MTGSTCQIEWAEQIRSRVDAEFDRVASAFRSVALRQKQTDRENTLAILAILEEKRSETMANQSAGYFIVHWQEQTDQIRRMIAADARYQSIREDRRAFQCTNSTSFTEKGV
jgi:conjugal transfer/entry exclusion protein